MSPLAAAAAQHNAANDQQESQSERDDVAESREGRWRVCRGRKDGVDRTSGTPRKGFHEIAATVDHRADASRGRADHGQAFLGCTEPSLGEVLRRTPASEPGVVRWIEDEGRAMLFVDHFAREDDLVAELEADLAPFAADVDGAWTRARCEVDVAGREA